MNKVNHTFNQPIDYKACTLTQTWVWATFNIVYKIKCQPKELKRG
jgi:hypothetical protein